MRAQGMGRRCLQALALTVTVCVSPAARAAGTGPATAGPGGAVPGNWQATVQEDIAAREYEVSWQTQAPGEGLAPAWQAPNRAHGFRTYFGDEGIRVIPRTEDSPSWTWRLALVGYGRGDALWSVPATRPVPSKNRVEYHRGQVEEWYVNAPNGLEQGFELRAVPEEAARQGGMESKRGRVALPGRGMAAHGAAPDAQATDASAETLLHLDLALSGSLSPIVADDGQTIDFATPGGSRVVRYSGLSVKDATGRALPAWLEGVADEAVQGIRIVIDDRDARFPIGVDPLATTAVWVVDSNQASAYLGWSTATAGDVNGDGYSDVIVGAYAFDNGQTDEGRAFLYLGGPGGPGFFPNWTAESDQAGAYFGNSVATAGDVNGDGYSDVIIGAENYSNGQSLEGRAYLYLGSATGLAFTPAWTAESDQAVGQFGTAVASAGDMNGDGYSDVIVGAAPYDFGGQSDVGAVFFFAGSAAGLNTTPFYVYTGDQVGCQFGLSVAPAGDVNGDGYGDVLIGAPNYSNGQSFEGRAYLVLGGQYGLSGYVWVFESDQASAYFGYSVGTAGDVNGDGYADIVIGSPYYDNGQTDEGRAYVYLGAPGGIAQSGVGSYFAPWTAEINQPAALFGNSVGTAGDVNGDGYSDIVVGAPYFDSSPQVDVGGAFVFLGSATGLGTLPAWSVAGPQPGDYYGGSVATAGDTNGDGYSDVIVGAAYYDAPLKTDAGAAYLYLGGPGGPSTTSSWNADSSQGSANLGFSVAGAGDVNGDGYSDVIVGVPFYDNGQTDEGRALLYLGSSGGLATTPAWTAESDQASAVFGFSVSTAGDVNGDGYSDVIVGAYAYDNGQVDEGRAFVYLGSAGGLGQTPAWTAESDQAGAWFGTAVASAGDVNGDGYSDIIVGAPLYDDGQSDEGSAFLYLGSAAGPALTPSWTGESNVGSARYGNTLSTAGDVNGDGYADVIIGAPYQSTAILVSAGAAYVYPGSPSGLAPFPVWNPTGVQNNENFGWSVSQAGDVNGDGFTDVIVGAPALDAPNQTAAGAAMVYLGSAFGPSGSPAWTVQGGQSFAYLGWSVATAGDVNGDGFTDVIVGAPYYDNGQFDEGRASIYTGSASGLGSVPAWTAESDQSSADFGYAVASAGDVNGDGYSDVIVGSPYFDAGPSDEGRAFLYYGNGGQGLAVRPQQRRADDASPIVLGLRSRTPGTFRLASLGHGSPGRVPVKLEWEVKARGRFFDRTGTQRGAAWTDSGNAGAGLNESVSGLEPNAYHWRVRILYRPSASPLVPASRWFSRPLNGSMETDVAISPFIGGVVWEDLNGNGIKDAGEPPLARLPVYLQGTGSGSGGATFTDNSGSYRFEILDTVAHRIAFALPTGYQYTLQDQGADDTLDSDADPFSGQTAFLGPPYQAVDGVSWSAGMLRIGPCTPPDEPVYIYNVRLSTDGKSFPILDYQDPNQPLQRTGYNVRRSSSAAPAKSTWPILATNVVDMDAATPNMQWVDTSGAVSPSGIWYYEVTAYNAVCGAEGPF